MTKEKKETKIGRKLFPLFWMVMIVLFLGVGVRNNMTLREIEASKSAIRAEIDEYAKKITELEHSRNYFDSAAYIEMIARDRLGLLKPDEVLFYKDTN